MPEACCPNAYGAAISVLTGGCVGIARWWVEYVNCKTQEFLKGNSDPEYGGRHTSTRSSKLWPFLKNARLFLFLLGFGVGCFFFEAHSRHLHHHSVHQVGYQSRNKSRAQQKAPNIPGNILHMPPTLQQTTRVPILNATQHERCSSTYTGGERAAGCSASPTAACGVCDGVFYDITDEVSNIRTSRTYIA